MVLKNGEQEIAWPNLSEANNSLPRSKKYKPNNAWISETASNGEGRSSICVTSKMAPTNEACFLPHSYTPGVYFTKRILGLGSWLSFHPAGMGRDATPEDAVLLVLFSPAYSYITDSNTNKK